MKFNIFNNLTSFTSSLRACGIACALLWWIQLDTAFFMDETITYVLSQMSFWETLEKSTHWQGNSAFYFLLMQIWTPTDCPEWLMRLPSICFAIISLLLLYKVTKPLASNTSCFAGLILLASSYNFITSMTLARTYALTLMLGLFTIYLIQTQLHKKSFWILWGIANCLMLYGHYYAAQLIPFQLYLIYLNSDKEFPYKQVLKSTILAALLFMPNIYQLGLIKNKADLYLILSSSSLFEKFEAVFSLELLVILIATTLGLIIISKRKDLLLRIFKHKLITIGVAWSLSSIIFLILLGELLGGDFIIVRYYIFALPGNMLIVAGLIHNLERLKLTLTPTLIALCCLIACKFHVLPERDVWSDIGKYLNTQEASLKECSLLNISSFTESHAPQITFSPKYYDYLSSPYQYYYKGKMDIIHLPTALKTKDKNVIHQKLSEAVADKPCLILLFNMLGNKAHISKSYMPGVYLAKDWLKRANYSRASSKTIHSFKIEKFTKP